jgi:pSer/pThr/pTyr-binding forkhead associated (FHA) protein
MTGIVVLILRILLLACLYGFLIWAFLTIWRDLRAQSQQLSAPFIPPLTMLPVEEVDQQPQVFSIPEVIVGRSLTSDFTITHDTVSARHARFSYHHNQWWVEDLNSTNGTFLNDERVSMATVVVSGDELRCGQVNLSIRVDDKKERGS